MTLRNNATTINNFDFKGNDILSIKLDGKDLFYGKPIAQLLDYVRPVKAINDHVKPKHRLTLKQSESPKMGLSNLWQGNDHQPKAFIDVSGIYSLVLHSTLPQAEEFQEWVTDEVLPEIQRTGSYNFQPKLPANNLDKLVQISTNLVQSQQETNLKIDDNTTRIENLENTMTIDSHEAKKIHDLGKHLALKAMGGKKSNAYQKIGHKVFTRLWINFDNHFDISTYKDLEKVKKNDALYWLSNKWRLDMDLQDEVDALNSQTDLDI